MLIMHASTYPPFEFISDVILLVFCLVKLDLLLLRGLVHLAQRRDQSRTAAPLSLVAVGVAVVVMVTNKIGKIG